MRDPLPGFIVRDWKPDGSKVLALERLRDQGEQGETRQAGQGEESVKEIVGDLRELLSARQTSIRVMPMRRARRRSL
jgi:hypothetical protein